MRYQYQTIPEDTIEHPLVQHAAAISTMAHHLASVSGRQTPKPLSLKDSVAGAGDFWIRFNFGAGRRNAKRIY